MPFEIVRNDIVNMQVDAVVNTANPDPIVGSGVDLAIHKKAGPKLLAARKVIGRIPFGEAVMTPGFHLHAKYVIHTVDPIWEDGNHNEEQLLTSCYRNSLALAKEKECRSIAFPLIATGNYGFPKPLALQIAIREIGSFLLDNEMQIYLVVFDKDSFVLSEKLFQSIRSYIDETYIDNHASPFIGSKSRGRSDTVAKREKSAHKRNHSFLTCMDACAAPAMQPQLDTQASLTSTPWDELLKNLDTGFSETLLRLIDCTGKKDSEIYKKANVDRKLFSKIRTNKNYQPSKTTALAFAFALELDLDETKDFIARAGFALSHSSKFDVIVEYFLVNRNYNLFELNEVLFAFDQPLIGA